METRRQDRDILSHQIREREREREREIGNRVIEREREEIERRLHSREEIEYRECLLFFYAGFLIFIFYLIILILYYTIQYTLYILYHTYNNIYMGI